MGVKSLGYLTLYAIEGSTTDEEDVSGVDMDVVLVGMLATSLWRHVDHCAFEQLEQALLDSLAADIARDGGVVALAGYLVYLVDEDNASLG